MARVNASFRLSSGTLQAFPKALIILPLQYLDAPAGRLYLLFGRLREGVRPHRHGPPDLPVPQDLDQNLLLPDEPGPPELLGADLVAIIKLRELPNVDRRVDDRVGGGVRSTRHALKTRQPALQGHLAALVGQVRLRPRAGQGPLVATTAGLAVPRARAAPEPFARLSRAEGRTKFVQPHYSSTSSTSTRWRTLLIIPRICGVSPCTFSSRIRLRPRARIVLLWPSFEPMTLFFCVIFRGLIARSSPPATARCRPSSGGF